MPPASSDKEHVAAARLRSVLRSARAFALSNAWSLWKHVSLESTHKTAPLLRELAVLRAEVSAQHDHGIIIHELQEQLMQTRAIDESLQCERVARQSEMAQELRRVKEALSASQMQMKDLNSALQNERAKMVATAREVAMQGARIAAEEHGQMMLQFRMERVLSASLNSRLLRSFFCWVTLSAWIVANNVSAP